MKLYITDLDGTLFNSQIKISEKSIKIINELMENGLMFTIATARSFESAIKYIKPLNLKLPIVLYNGVYIYDPIKRENLICNYVDNTYAEKIIEELVGFKLSPLVYSRNHNSQYKIFHRGITNYGEKHYYDDRIANGDNRFELVKEYGLNEQNIISILVIGEPEVLEPIYIGMKKKHKLSFHYSIDIYSKAAWLEITAMSATKGQAVNSLRSIINLDSITCFGDNMNDISMFQIAEEKYAVENAVEDLKKIATKVIKSNDLDGVAEFLLEDFKYTK